MKHTSIDDVFFAFTGSGLTAAFTHELAIVILGGSVPILLKEGVAFIKWLYNKKRNG